MKFAAIARNTFREATRDRALLGVLIAGAVLILATQPLGTLALGEGQKLTVDLGLSGISFFGLLIILMVGTSLVAKEIERRTIFNLLSRPSGRPADQLGKWLGLSAALWVVAIVLGAVLWVSLLLRGFGSYGPAVAQGAYLAGLELSVVTGIAVLFSALSTPVLSALYTLGLYCAGQWSADLRQFGQQAPGALGPMLRLMADLVPNLPVFNMRALAAHGDVTTPFHLGVATAYALLYCGCVLALAAAAFESRDFK